MKINRYHDRIGIFSRNAEALADYALNRPVATADQLNLEEDHLPDESFARARVWIHGQPIDGYSKLVLAADAAPQLLAATVATIIGAPSAPCILLRKCAPHPYDRAPYQKGRTVRLFSAVPDADHVGGKHEEGGEIVTGEVTSLAAAGQFRAWLHDDDDFRYNVARSRWNGTVWTFDHEQVCMRGAAHKVDPESRRFIEQSWQELDPEERTAYRESAAVMAARIHQADRYAIGQVAGNLRNARLGISHSQVRCLVNRRRMFKQPVVLDKLQP